MSKIATLRQVCQLTIDHLQTFDSKIQFGIKSLSFEFLRSSIPNNQRR